MGTLTLTRYFPPDQALSNEKAKEQKALFSTCPQRCYRCGQLVLQAGVYLGSEVILYSENDGPSGGTVLATEVSHGVMERLALCTSFTKKEGC